MSASPQAFAAAASEARRQAHTERLATGLALVMLGATVLYSLIGDAPFGSRTLAQSADVSPVNRYLWLALFVLSVPVLWLRRQRLLPLAIASWPMLLLFAWFAATTSWALDPSASVRRLLLYGVVLLLAFATASGLSRAQAHAVMALCGGTVILADLASWPVVPDLAMSPLGFTGMHPQKNVAGAVALFAALACGTWLLRPRAGLRAVIGVMFCAAVLVILVARSLTSLLLGLGIAVLLPLLRRGLAVRPAWLAATAACLVVMPVAFLLTWLAWAAVAGTDPLAPLAGVTLTERTDLWEFLLENIARRPWGGAGFGSFWAIDPAVQPSLQTGLWFAQGEDIANEGHNAYLDLAATTGLIGLGLTLAVFGRATWLAALRVRAGGSSFPLAFLLVLAAHDMTESGLFTANSPFGTVFVILAIQLEQARLQTRR